MGTNKPVNQKVIENHIPLSYEEMHISQLGRIAK